MVVYECEIWQVRHPLKQQLRTAGAEKWLRLGKDTQRVVVWLCGQVQVLVNAGSLKKPRDQLFYFPEKNNVSTCTLKRVVALCVGTCCVKTFVLDSMRMITLKFERGVDLCLQINMASVMTKTKLSL